MPAPTYGTDIPNGFAGVGAATPDSIIESYPNVSSGYITNGQPVIQGTGGVKPADATATTSNFVGIAVRQVQTQTSYSTPNAAGAYGVGAPVSTMIRGKSTAQCLVGTPALWGAVYLRTVLNSSIPTGIVGGLEANADGGNSFAIPKAIWGGAADTNGNASIIIKETN